MRVLIITLLLLNMLSAQSEDVFLAQFIDESNLKPQHELQEYHKYDFSHVWMQTSSLYVYGIIGEEHQRIEVKLLGITRDNENPETYLVTGRSRVKDNICDFTGKIELTTIYELKELHFGIDDEFASRKIQSQGIAVASYCFYESKDQRASGIFKGKLYSKWYLDAEGNIKYDNIEFRRDNYMNNAFIGNWKSYRSRQTKKCNWADYRVPLANQDFDIGAAEFSVSKKYWPYGWADTTNNQAW